MDYISPIKENLDFWMHKNCKTFIVIGFPRESPRWFNFGGFNLDTKELTIKSTLTNLGFKIPTKFNHIETNEFWKQFKNYRTEFLKENYPTINPY